MEPDARVAFFHLVFGNEEGFLNIASQGMGSTFVDKYFHYPNELQTAVSYIDRIQVNNNVWFSAQLYRTPYRNKSNIINCTSVWADLDDCAPEQVALEPSIVITSSTGRYQGLWLLDKPEDPIIAEEKSRNLAYFYAELGADKSGWDLTQLLRVPYTVNFKYEEMPKVLVRATRKRYSIDDFSMFPTSEQFKFLETPIPPGYKHRNLGELMASIKNEISGGIWSLFYNEPTADWSAALWKLELMLFESGLSAEDVFLVARNAKCNKYARDDRSDFYLWREVLKAQEQVRQNLTRQNFRTVPLPFELQLLSDTDRDYVKNNPTLIEEYVTWCESVTDAAQQYHQGSAFIILSAMVAGTVRLPTSFGDIIPNIWLMILADTTLTRKTTAMDMAMSIIQEIDEDAVLATDGSIEGMLTSLQARPNRVSIFLRDEVSGLLEAMRKKDYHAGMAESLTKMYDGKQERRVLRKETIIVNDPVVLVYMGGIRAKIIEILDHRAVHSGFLPRFLIIEAEADFAKLKPIGPPNTKTSEIRKEIIQKFEDIRKTYDVDLLQSVHGKTFPKKKRFFAELTPDAWRLYNEYEARMLEQAQNSYMPEVLTPTMDRLAKSGLKMSVLIACTRMEPEILVGEEDIKRSFFFIELWSRFTLDLVENLGKSFDEKTLEQALKMIARAPNGIAKSILMRNLRLTTKTSNDMISTLKDRGLIVLEGAGSGTKLRTVQ